MEKVTKAFVFATLTCMLITAPTARAQDEMGQAKGQQMSKQNMDKMRAMHEEMMKGMQADLDSMKATLEQMKGQLGKVSDAAVHEQLQWNVDLWQKMLDNMDKHMTMIKQMMESHKGMMMHHNGMMKGSPSQRPPSPK